MELPFTTAQFLDNFKNYNTAVYPAQIIFSLLAIAVIYFQSKKSGHPPINLLLRFYPFFGCGWE